MATEAIYTKSLGGAEDLLLDASNSPTVIQTRAGKELEITKINSSTIPYSGKFGDPAMVSIKEQLDSKANMGDSIADLVGSIADLLALPEGQRKDGLLYMVKGYHAGSDIGGGEFYWNSDDLSDSLVTKVITTSSVDILSNRISTTGYELSDGDAVVLRSTINGLAENTVYWVVNSDGTSFQLSETPAGVAVLMSGASQMLLSRLADPLHGIYVPRPNDHSGTHGAFVRQCGQSVRYGIQGRPEWFGAVGDGVAVDYINVQSALNILDMCIGQDGATYYLGNNSLINKRAGIQGKFTFKRDQLDGQRSHVLLILNVDNREFSGFSVIGGHTEDIATTTGASYSGPNIPTNGETGGGIVLISCSHLSFERLSVINTWGDSITLTASYYSGIYPNARAGVQCKSIKIERCRFINPLRGTVTGISIDGLEVAYCYHYKRAQYVGTLLFEPNYNMPTETTRNINIHHNTIDTDWIAVVITSASQMILPAANISITDNEISAFSFLAANQNGTTSLTFSRNKLRQSTRLSDGTQPLNISVLGATGCDFYRNEDYSSTTVYPAAYANVGWAFAACTSVNIDLNRFLHSAKQAFNVLHIEPGCSGVSITRNTFMPRDTPDINGQGVVKVSAVSGYLTIEKNMFPNMTSPCIRFEGSGFQQTQISRNFLQTSVSRVKLLFLGDSTNNATNDIVIDDNIYQGAGPRVLGGEFYLRDITSVSKKLVGGLAAPTTGTWTQGDRVEVTQPVAGGFSGFVCVTSGTPGTWKGYGLIST